MFLVIPGAETWDCGERLSGLWGLCWLISAPSGAQHLPFHLHILCLGVAPPSAQASHHFLLSVQQARSAYTVSSASFPRSIQVQARGYLPRED